MSTTKFLAVASAAALTAGASAQIATFTFSDLDGSYNAGTQVFSAVADATTSGDVTRLVSPVGSAQFNTGFTTLATSANVAISLTLSNLTATSADAVGSFVITDHNGDTMTGDINGSFQPLGFSITFDGLLSNVAFTDNSSDGTFDGPSSGAFSSAFINPPFDGAIVQLFLSTSGFFASSFSGTPVLVDAAIIPAPASLALVGLGGLVAARRRR